MPTDITSETVIPFNKAREHFPGRPHLSTLHRWRMCGCRGRRLESFLSGGRRYTSLEAIRRFLQHGVSAPEFDARESEVDRQRRAEVAKQELENLGV
jgi:hypothetical protein